MDVLETRMFLDRKEARIKFEQKDFKITVTCFIQNFKPVFAKKKILQSDRIVFSHVSHIIPM